MNNLLRIENIKFNINGFEILKGVTFNVKNGEIVSLIGPNGSGKTTFFNVINGFLRPTSGEIIYAGQNINSSSIEKRAEYGIGRLWQDVRLFEKMTTIENLIVAVKNHPGEKLYPNFLKRRLINNFNKTIYERAKHYLEITELIDKKNVTVENLSFGQKKLVSLCRLFMNNAKLLLLDEPFAGVNYVMMEKIKEIIIKIKQEDKTAIIIEHNIAKAKEISDNMFLMDYGKIVLHGTPKAVTESDILKKVYAGI